MSSDEVSPLIQKDDAMQQQTETDAGSSSTPESSDKTETVRLKSSDDKIFEISVKAAFRSSLLKDMIEMLGNDPSGLDAPIPMVNVDAVNLEKITQFLTRHENTELYKDPPPGPIAVPGAELSAIAALTDDEIVDLLLATNYMGVNQFRDFICQHIANLIKGKTPEEVRARFNLENDFTPEQEKHIREVDVWADKLPDE